MSTEDSGFAPSPHVGSADAARRSEVKLSQENFTTVVFVHMNEEQRQELMAFVHSKWDVKDGLRVTALSADHEMTRLHLIEEALEREGCLFDLRETIEEIIQSPDVSAWDWEAMLDE